MPYETIRCEKDDGVAVLTLHRPERHNAIDATMARELPDAWRALKADDDVLVVIVTGAGERAFCTGFDVGAIASGNAAVADGDGTRAPLGFTAIHNGCFKPVITAVNGIVCGGGLHFVADSDLVVAAEHATFFDSHVDVGMVAGLEPIGLARRMPLGAVLRMACVGRAERMTATRAFELGLVGDVVPGASLLAHARQLADRIKQCSPAAVQATKRAIWESLDLGLADALELGWRAVEGHRGHPDVAEGARAFRERRAPRWIRWHIGPETTP